MPEPASVTVPVTGKGEVKTVAPSVGDVIVTLGGVLSIFNAGEVKVFALPATSVTVTVPVTAKPSVESNSGLASGIVKAIPDSESLGVNGTETSALFHPAALAGGLAVPNVNVGGVLSILNADDVKVVLLPAL